MWFLLTQIFLLLLLAALFGAAMAYWWMKSRYEDVTETHSELMDQSRLFAGKGLTRDDLKAEVATLTSSLPQPDLEPLSERLARLETYILAPDESLDIMADRMSDLEGTIRSLTGEVTKLQNTDLTPVESRLHGVEQALGGVRTDVDLGPLEYRLAQIETALSNLDTSVDIDFGPIHSGIARMELALENMDFPHTDLDPVRSHLGAMESRLAEFNERLDASRKSDLETMMIRMQTLSSSIAQLRMPDMDGVNLKLNRIEKTLEEVSNIKIDVPAVDLDSVHERLRLIENQLRYRDEPKELMTKIADMEDALATLMGRMTHLSSQVGAIKLPSVSLEPIQDQMRLIETRLMQPKDDFSPVFARLSDIEAATAALHHKLSNVETSISMIDRTQVDMTPVQARLVNMDQQISTLRSELRGVSDLAPIERRLSVLQDAVMNMREPDLTPLVSSMRSLDSRLDMNVVENRLTSIEYGLAAVHDMLRRRAEGTTRTTETEVTYRPRQPRAERVETRQTFADLEVKRQPLAEEPTTSTSTRRRRRGDDAIDQYVREGDQANLLKEAAFGTPDDLEEINGVGPMLAQLLNDVGVFYFWQVAEWSPEDVEWVDEKLQHFRGRISRDDWVGQAGILAQRPDASPRP